MVDGSCLTTGADETHDKEKLDRLLQHLMEDELITDGTIARDNTQLQVDERTYIDKYVFSSACTNTDC